MKRLIEFLFPSKWLKSRWSLLLCPLYAFLLASFLMLSAYAITNLVVVVTVSDDQYTNLVAIAAQRGQTPEQFLRSTNMGLATEFNREHNAVLLRMLLQLWENAPLSNKLAAIEALR